MVNELWETEKARRVEGMRKSQEYVNQLGHWLQQIGIQPPSVMHGKLDAIVNMLIELDIVTERQVMDMEEKFAEDVIKELETIAKKVRLAAIAQGATLPPMPVNGSGLIVPGG